jgi:phage tail sheath protein FI
LRISAPAATGPGGAPYDRRIYDATIRLAEPVPAPAAGEKSWLTDFTDQTYGVKAAPSRLQLGAAYPAAILNGTATAGADGDPSGQPSPTAFLNAVTALDALDPFFNTLCLPDLVRPSANDPHTPFYSNAMSIYNEAALVCADKFAFLIIDPPCNVVDAGSALAWKTLGFTFQSNHAGAWFPNIRVDDPLVTGAIRTHPPSGAIAGVIARMDGEYGVWQSPAGTDASLNGAYGPSVLLSDSDHGLLNPVGLNCIRQFPVYGTVGFGSRTVDGSDLMASDYKYVAVRRVANYILLTLTGALRWAVHKPNGEELWSQLRLSVNAFMQTLFRQGAFKGVSAKDAYFVLCDSTTTTPTDINNGTVNIVIGFAPLKPAEFVVISLTQIVQPAS